MQYRHLEDPVIAHFIRHSVKVDIAELALQSMPSDWPRIEILNQIKSRQKAVEKLPGWAFHEKLILPAPEVVEQASSEESARYKATIIPSAERIIDCTAGLGSDFVAFLKHFKKGIAIEANADNVACLKQNIPHFTNASFELYHANAENIVHKLPAADLIYVDPQRRTDQGKKGLYQLDKTQPNLLSLLPNLRAKAPKILIKCSPFLDIHEAIRQLPDTTEVHVVERNKHCREVLYLLEPKSKKDDVKIFSVRLKPYGVFQSTLSQRDAAQIKLSEPLRLLYDPGPALLKSGLHDIYAQTMGLAKLALMTHLYTSQDVIPDYPGRAYEILDVLPLDKKTILKALSHSRVNIVTKNIPQTPESIYKKLGCKEGGELMLYVCKLQDNKPSALLCRPL